MIRAFVTLVALVAVFLFGYYFFSDRSSRGASEKAADAGRQVLSTATDTGGAVVVSGNLKSELGLEAASFLHVYYDEGRVVIYGLAPEGITAERIEAVAKSAPRVTSVQVLVQPRPAGMTPVWAAESAPPPAPEPRP